jgi:acetyl esterase/lipase
MAVAGSSAGGTLALLLGTTAEVPELEGEVGGNVEQSSQVQAVINYFGPSDFVLRGKTQPDVAYTEQSGSFALLGGKQLGAVDKQLELAASAAHHVSASSPPLLVMHGTADKLVLMDQADRIVEAYQAHQLPVQLMVLEGAGHGDARFFWGDTMTAAIDFLNQHRP